MNTALKKSLLIALCASSAAVMVGCKWGGDDDAPASTSSTSSTTSMSGTVTKGPVTGATVTIYKVNSDGSQGEKVAGPFTTASDGTWNGDVPAGVSGPFMLVATGGKYVDEADTSKTVEIGTDTLVSIVNSTAGAKVTAPITPYTHAIALAAQKMASENKDPAAAIKTAVSNATKQFGFDPTSVIPPDPLNVPASATTAQVQYAALLGGIAQLAKDNAPPPGVSGVPASGIPGMKIIGAIIEDMADGKLDGKNLAGTAITIKPASNVAAMAIPALGSSDLTKIITSATAFTEARKMVNPKTPYATTAMPTGFGAGGGFYTMQSTPSSSATATSGTTSTTMPTSGTANTTMPASGTANTTMPASGTANTVVNSGTGNYNLVVTATVMGMASPPVTITNVPKPANESEFCNSKDIKERAASAMQGGTVTVKSCSFNGTTGNVSLNAQIMGMSMDYSAKYEYMAK